MAYAPVNNNFELLVTYDALYLQGNTDVCGFLAAPTGGLTYVPGVLMAVYTSGANAGQYVNYDSTGTNGQAVCIGWLDEQYLPHTYPTGGIMANIKFGNAMVNNAKLVVSHAGDIPTGMAQLGARYIPNVSGVNIWYVP